MTAVRTPVAGFSGVVVGVVFTDGAGATEDPTALAYFARHGYEVGDVEVNPAPEIPEGDPTEKWTVAHLVAFAAREEIDLGEATKKADILAAILGASEGDDESGDEPDDEQD